jgi:hypothetical protein
VKQGLEALDTQESLVCAGLLTLKKSPAERSRFEDGAAQEILKVFSERLEKIEEEISTNGLLSEDGLVLAAEALFDAMLQNAATKLLVVVESREAKDTKNAELDVAKLVVADQAKILGSCEAEHSALNAKIVDLKEVLVMVHQLTECTDIVASPEKSATKCEDEDNEAEAYRIYTGSISHPDLGKEAIPIRVVLYTPTQGKWTAYDQTDHITVVCEGDQIRLMDSTTELEGQDVGGGAIRGVVIQAGSRGGEFDLQIEAEDNPDDVQMKPANLDGLFDSALESSNAKVENSATDESPQAAEEPELAEQSLSEVGATPEEAASAQSVGPTTHVEAPEAKVEATAPSLDITTPAKAETTGPSLEATTPKTETTEAQADNETEIEVATANGGA